MTSRRSFLACASAALVAVALIAGCGSSDPETGSPVVVATTGIWGDVVANVACDGLAEVRTLIPAGGDPHGFEPSLADRAELERASLVVANGLGLEEGLEETIAAVEENGVSVFRAAENVDSLALDGGEGDPHVWMDPVRVKALSVEIGDALVNEVGVDRAAVSACVAGYRDRLDATEARMTNRLSTIPPTERKLVTNHDSLGYFADRFGFEVVGTVIPSSSTLAQTSPSQLEALAATIRRAGVAAIFVETQNSDADARALAERIGGVEVITLFSGALGEPGSGADSYVGLMETNADRIVAGLT